MQRLFIDSAYARMLAEEGLGSFSGLYNNELQGHILDEEPHRMTKRVELDGRIFYFKRVFRSSPRKSLEALFKLRVPHHYCWREMEELRCLREAGFSVAAVVAAGEATRIGVPFASFLMTLEVPGLSLSQAVEESDDTGREELLTEFGTYTARLHLAGFFTPVRQKDVICGDSGEDWTLIDRETRHPGARSFSPQRATEALNRTFRRETRYAPAWGNAAYAVFSEGYCRTVATRWAVRNEELTRICRMGLPPGGVPVS